MVNLLFEVVEDILSLLPVKPLKRLRCVAKSWHSLIDSEGFVKSHLKRTLETNSHRHLIAGGDKGLFYKVDLDNDAAKVVASSVVKLPVSSVNGISNSCNGLFVISADPLVLWSPYTRECRNLPGIVDDNFPVPLGCYSNIVCGIVWDSRNEDYKVVRILEHRDTEFSTVVASRAHIFGLKSNSWRQTAQYTYPVKNWEADVNGALHTLIFDFTVAGLDPGPYQIKAFSVESERHYDVKLPPLGDIWANGAVSMSVHKLGGCLALNYTNESEIVIWVMKHYGVRSSWKKILSIPMKPAMHKLDDDSMKPLVYSKDGHKVLVCFGQGTFFWQDVRNQSIESVLFKGLPRKTGYVEACVESLVSFRGEPVHKQVKDQDKEKDKKKTRKKRDDLLSMGFKLVL